MEEAAAVVGERRNFVGRMVGLEVGASEETCFGNQGGLGQQRLLYRPDLKCQEVPVPVAAAVAAVVAGLVAAVVVAAAAAAAAAAASSPDLAELVEEGVAVE